MARRKLAIRPLMGLGAAAGLLVAMQLGTPEDASRLALPLVAVGAAAGAAWSYWRLPDAKVCRIPRVLWGCGGQTTVQDTDGNSRPRRPCWGHPGGKPKRLVNLLVVAGELAAAGLLLAVLVTVVAGQ